MGDTDLSLGINYLKNLQKYSKIQFVSSNLKDKKTKHPIFEPYLIKEANESSIGIIGLLTPNVPPYWHREMEGCFIEDPMKAAIEIINGSLYNCDHIVILAHLSSSEIESLANRISKTLIIIGGNDRSFIFPKKINQSLWVQTDPLGYRIGRMNLRLIKGSSEFVDVGARSALQKNIEKIQKLIDDPQHAKEIKSLIRLRETLSEQKKKLPDAEGRNAYENYLTYLHQEMKSDPEIEGLIAGYKND
jgi:2',3'-cyclic-nucleotide 2'-phosphodiesterase (5'-nucleotidase family)